MIVLNILILLLSCVFSNCFTCRNENNESVDWYYLYKLPIGHSSNLIKNGSAYLFMTSNNFESGWKLSNISINDENSILGLTLQPFYKNKTSMHVLYNDEKPSGSKNEYLGHTKGTIISDENTGFWLIHSVPKFPPIDNYYYPDTGVRYGQSFLCISLNLENINNVGEQLQYNEPNIYKSYINETLTNKLGNIYSVINHEKITSAPWYRLTNIFSLNGEKFVSFAKGRKFGKEIYEDWVAPTLKSDLLVQSWLNGPGRIPSDCNHIYQVNNVEKLKLFESFSFTTSKDHSKWAVTNSKDNTKNWICVGDINREERQKQRGGGTVCISHQKIWNEYKRIVIQTELCEK